MTADTTDTTDATDSTEPVEATEGTEATEATEATEDAAGTDAADAAETSAGRSRRGAAQADLEREGEVAADFLESLLDIADLDGDLDVDIDGDRAAVSIIDGEDGTAPRVLVGQRGAVLDALQELTRLAVQAETGNRSRLMLDVAGHRAERRRDVLAETERLVALVRESGEPQEMSPADAFERKVAHDAILQAGLHSESEGKEPNRYVVIHASA